MSRSNRDSLEVRERAVRLVSDHEHDHPSQWAAIRSIAEKVGREPRCLGPVVSTASGAGATRTAPRGSSFRVGSAGRGAAKKRSWSPDRSVVQGRAPGPGRSPTAEVAIRGHVPELSGQNGRGLSRSSARLGCARVANATRRPSGSIRRRRPQRGPTVSSEVCAGGVAARPAETDAALARRRRPRRGFVVRRRPLWQSGGGSQVLRLRHLRASRLPAGPQYRRPRTPASG